MKTHFTILLLMAFMLSASAQSIDKQVVATAGNTIDNGTYKITSTIGEPIVGLKGNTVSINQGFLAGVSNDAALSVEELIINKAIKIFPNPVTDIVNINITENTDIVTAAIYNTTGKLVDTYQINTNIKSLNLSHLANGMYLVQLQSKATNTIKSFKIIKK